MNLVRFPVLNHRFGQVIRQLRDERGWSQERLAEAANLNRSYLGEIERGDATPSLTTLDKLAQALQVKISTILERCEELPTP